MKERVGLDGLNVTETGETEKPDACKMALGLL